MPEFPDVFNRNVLYECDVDQKTGQLIPKLNSQGGYDKNPLLLKFESKIGMPLRQVPFGYMAEHYLKGDGTIDPTLIQTKVVDLVMQGADFIPIFNQIALIQDMTAPKMELPVSSYTGFKAVKGIQGATSARTAGGYTDAIELDCSNGRGMYRVNVAMQKYWIRQAQWSAVENALRDAGQVMYDEVAGVLLKKATDDVDTTMTNTLANWQNTYCGMLATMFGKMATAQVRPTCAIITASATALAALETPFSNQLYANLASLDIKPETGLFGYLMPFRLPIYYHYKQTAASATMLNANKALALGIFQPLTVEGFNDVWSGTEGGVITMQFDAKSGKDAKNKKPTKLAWAVGTGTA